MGAVADEQVVAADAGRVQPVELGHERRRVDDHAVAEQVQRPGREDSRWDQVQLEVPVRVDHGVAGVVAAAVADDEVRVGRKVVDDAALALVSPLRADDGGDGHGAATMTSAAGWDGRQSYAVGHAKGAAAAAPSSVRSAMCQARARTLSKQLLQ